MRREAKTVGLPPLKVYLLSLVLFISVVLAVADLLHFMLK